MITFSQRTGFMFSQPVRCRIILYPLAFVLHAQLVFDLASTGSPFEIQTSNHNQLPYRLRIQYILQQSLVASFTPRITAEMVYLAGVHETAPHTG